MRRMVADATLGARGVWRRLGWLGVFAVAMGLLEAICVIYLRRLLPMDSGLTVLPSSHRGIEVIREACTIVMLCSVAWLSGINGRSRIACFFYTFGIWDILYYVGLWWLAGWPESLLTWDCLFLIPKPWYGPVLAPVIISLYFIAGCLWLHAREIRGEPMRLSATVVAAQIVAASLWYWSFVKDTEWIARHKYEGVSYSWPLLIAGVVIGIMGLWFACRAPRRPLTEASPIGDVELP